MSRPVDRLKLVAAFSSVVDRVDSDPDDTLFLTLDPREAALTALGFSLVEAFFAEYADDAEALRTKFFDAVGAQKDDEE